MLVVHNTSSKNSITILKALVKNDEFEFLFIEILKLCKPYQIIKYKFEKNFKNRCPHPNFILF